MYTSKSYKEKVDETLAKIKAKIESGDINIPEDTTNIYTNPGNIDSYYIPILDDDKTYRFGMTDEEYTNLEPEDKLRYEIDKAAFEKILNGDLTDSDICIQEIFNRAVKTIKDRNASCQGTYDDPYIGYLTPSLFSDCTSFVDENDMVCVLGKWMKIVPIELKTTNDYEVGDLLVFHSEGHVDSPVLESFTNKDQVIKVDDDYVYCEHFVYDIKNKEWQLVDNNNIRTCFCYNTLEVFRKNDNNEYVKIREDK